MRKETFAKIQKNLAILLICSFLILVIIPSVVVAGYMEDSSWKTNAYQNFELVDKDINSLSELSKNAEWQSSALPSTENITKTSQAAIKESDSVDVGEYLLSAKIELKLAMEQASQLAVYVNKAVEAHKNGNNKDEQTYLQLANACVESYKKHRENEKYITMQELYIGHGLYGYISRPHAVPKQFPNAGWVTDAYQNFELMDKDINSLSKLSKNAEWQSSALPYTENITKTSQAAIKESDSVDVDEYLLSAKIELKLAMEQASQLAVYVNKAVEAHKNGNNKDEQTYLDLANSSVKSYRWHKENVYFITNPDLVHHI